MLILETSKWRAAGQAGVEGALHTVPAPPCSLAQLEDKERGRREPGNERRPQHCVQSHINGHPEAGGLLSPGPGRSLACGPREDACSAAGRSAGCGLGAQRPGRVAGEAGPSAAHGVLVRPRRGLRGEGLRAGKGHKERRGGRGDADVPEHPEDAGFPAQAGEMPPAGCGAAETKFQMGLRESLPGRAGVPGAGHQLQGLRDSVHTAGGPGGGLQHRGAVQPDAPGQSGGPGPLRQVEPEPGPPVAAAGRAPEGLHLRTQGLPVLRLLVPGVPDTLGNPAERQEEAGVQEHLEGRGGLPCDGPRLQRQRGLPAPGPGRQDHQDPAALQQTAHVQLPEHEKVRQRV
ncbi:epididymal-specific lipocalin-6 isoform X3 [Bos javanicus]|uniref:epididymal-specific lipocalin-6 isoform X3 n=1 Tax=Bos javanicus TaxID=9906 RepID=UPI002AA6233A|nr:epididymal-specific lipocalin-6 isoform X3 [Bos javanicus]